MDAWTAGNRYFLAYGGADGDGFIYFVLSVGVGSRRFTSLSKASGTEDIGIEAIQRNTILFSISHIMLFLFIIFSTQPIHFLC